MTETPLTTSWLWKDGEELNGLKINQEKQKLEWFDGVGCACGDSTAEQTVAEFRQRGASFGNPPEDVLAELETALMVLKL